MSSKELNVPEALYNIKLKWSDLCDELWNTVKTNINEKDYHLRVVKHCSTDDDINKHPEACKINVNVNYLRLKSKDSLEYVLEIIEIINIYLHIMYENGTQAYTSDIYLDIFNKIAIIRSLSATLKILEILNTLGDKSRVKLKENTLRAFFGQEPRQTYNGYI